MTQAILGKRVADPSVVIDLGYGRVTSSRTPGAVLADVGQILDAVDSPTVRTASGTMPVRQAWRMVFHQLGPAIGGVDSAAPLIVGHPSTWGPRRASVLSEVGVYGRAVSLVPRAILIARSHCDPAVLRCAVVETTHVPRPIVDPARPPKPAWDVAILRRASSGWMVERNAVLDPADGQAGVMSIIDDTVEAVFVDGADPADVDAAVEVVTAHAVAGRVVPAEPRLVLRYGARTGVTARPHSDAAEPVLAVPARSTRPRTAILVAAAVVAMLAAAGVVAVGMASHREQTRAVEPESVVVGRTTLTVPGGWRQTAQPTPSGTRADPSTSRTLFVSAEDGRRILLIQTRVRSDSTLSSVATSLGNRMRQRGDDVVTEFSPSTRFAGRDVISYREEPASGSAIRWYVIVDDGLQVSIGCQPGNAAEPVDTECEQAVRTAVIAPR
ncbi:type VII secretion-associated protein [Gordonia sp. NPDC003422]